MMFMLWMGIRMGLLVNFYLDNDVCGLDGDGVACEGI